MFDQTVEGCLGQEREYSFQTNALLRLLDHASTVRPCHTLPFKTVAQTKQQIRFKYMSLPTFARFKEASCVDTACHCGAWGSVPEVPLQTKTLTAAGSELTLHTRSAHLAVVPGSCVHRN